MRFSEVLGASSCVGCGAAGLVLCGACERALAPASIGGAVDGVERVLAGFAYEGAARALVLGLKLRHRRGCGGPLVEGMARVVYRHGLLGSLVTWVPGRRRDILDRGFDHATLLARGVSRKLGLPTRGLLVRTGHSFDQTELGRDERFSNLQGAIRSKPVSGRVVLIDDLVTTGATAGACARALRDAGASSVEVLTACRV